MIYHITFINRIILYHIINHMVPLSRPAARGLPADHERQGPHGPLVAAQHRERLLYYGIIHCSIVLHVMLGYVVL